VCVCVCGPTSSQPEGMLLLEDSGHMIYKGHIREI
jgi:hypothetical protein